MRYSPDPPRRVVDVFDRLSTFKLISYQRPDNGYCGEDSEPYGCLGESRAMQAGFQLPPKQPQSASSRY